MGKYRKKPVVIEAFRMGIDPTPDWFADNVTDRTVTLRTDKPSSNTDPFDNEVYKTWCEIETLEGTMVGNYGDYIIKGNKGEIYPCKPDIFEATYELVEE